MSTKILGKAGKKLFERHLDRYAPADPLYEFYTDNHGKKCRRKRELPQGLSARDAKILMSVKKRAHYLDKGFTFCGFRFGWTFLIGVIPGAGDILDACLNYLLVVRKCRQAELPGWLVRKMHANNAVSALVGLVPFIGDVILAMYKANSRNAALLEEFLRIRGEEYLKLKAEGRDVAYITAAVTTDKKKSTLRKRKDKSKDKAKEQSDHEEIVPGVSKSDVEQVKPGAGKATREIILIPPARRDVPKGSAPSTSAAAVDARATSSASSSAPSEGSRTQKFLNGWRRKSGSGKVPGERGRFVENFGSGTGIDDSERSENPSNAKSGKDGTG